MLIAAAAWIAKLHNARLVHYTMDLYPEIAVALGLMRPNAPAAHLLGAVYRRSLRNCDLVLSLGERMTDRLVGKGARPDAILYAPPWADARLAQAERTSSNAFRDELGIPPNDTLVMYAGNIGRAHEFATLIQAIRDLRDEPRMHWIFIGDGARRAELEEALAGDPNPRARFLPYQPRNQLGEVLSAADIHLITQDPRSVGLIVPSKLAAVLAVGRPVAYVGGEGAEVARCLSQNDCGVAVGVGDIAGLSRALRELAASRTRRARCGANARRAFEAQFDRRRVTERIISAVELLAR
jgi:glycosyltransferase involved in cell wall biosynthesis